MIVITGLDGSGKSTLLTKLESQLGERACVLRIPTIDTEKFKHIPELYKVCKFINYLGVKADQEKQPSLKIISMFGSILLFEDLHEALIEKGNKIVFCERHPMIDTGVYGRAYYEAVHPDFLDTKMVESIEKTYHLELKGILERLNVEIQPSGKGVCYDLLSFLYEWFSVEENYTSESLQHLFSIKKPEKIYFLDAPAKTLVERLDVRKTKEFHENESTLERLRPFYMELLKNSKVPFQIINTSDWTEVDVLYDDLLKVFA